MAGAGEDAPGATAPASEPEAPPPPPPPPPPLEPVLALGVPSVESTGSDVARIAWREAGLSLPASSDPAQAEVQAITTYSLTHELQMQEISADLGAPSAALAATVASRAVDGDWRTVHQAPACSAQVRRARICARMCARAREPRTVRTLDSPPAAAPPRTPVACRLPPRPWRMSLVVPPSLCPLLRLRAAVNDADAAARPMQVTGLRPGRWYAVRLACTPVAVTTPPAPLAAEDTSADCEPPPHAPATPPIVLRRQHSPLRVFRTVPTPPGPMQAPALTQRARNALKVRRQVAAATRGQGASSRALPWQQRGAPGRRNAASQAAERRQHAAVCPALCRRPCSPNRTPPPTLPASPAPPQLPHPCAAPASWAPAAQVVAARRDWR